MPFTKAKRTEKETGQTMPVHNSQTTTATTKDFRIKLTKGFNENSKKN